MELLEKLATLTPRPRINLVFYHGVLAPHARWRTRVVASEAPPVAPPPDAGAEDRPASRSPRYWAWATLMRRAFDLDVLAYPQCGGRLRLIATVEDPRVIRRILTHLGPPTKVPAPDPAHPPPAPASDLFVGARA